MNQKEGAKSGRVQEDVTCFILCVCTATMHQTKSQTNTGAVIFSISGLPSNLNQITINVSCRLYGLCHLVQVQFDLQRWYIPALFVWLCRWVTQMNLYFKWLLWQRSLTGIYLSLVFFFFDQCKHLDKKKTLYFIYWHFQYLLTFVINKTVHFLSCKYCNSTPWLTGHTQVPIKDIHPSSRRSHVLLFDQIESKLI